MDSIIGKLRSHAAEKSAGIAYTVIDEAGREQSITFSELYKQATKIAANLRETLDEGQRVGLLLPTSLDYIKSFYGCLLAGLIAIPLYPPTNPKSVQRLTKIVADSQASIALTTSNLAEELGDSWAGEPVKFISASEIARRSNVVDYDASFKLHPIAFLQYTSGSTGDPKGVIISQENVIANIRAATSATKVEAGETFCSWLPLHHDMGMVVSILTPLYLGGHSVIMSPTRFIRRPRRWLEAISHHKAVLTASPNFAFDLCVDRVTDDSVVSLDLTSWRVAINGAEPLNAKSIAGFAEKFSSIGFSNTTIYPAYGMAEATVFVAGGNANSEPVTASFKKLELQQDDVVPTVDGDNSVCLVACGLAQEFHDLRIVDPEQKRELRELEVGEIWFTGPSVSDGYWNRPDETSASFGFQLHGQDGYKYLRTGDLGFKYRGELYITGRIKDLIIVKGKNYYPNDLERDCANIVLEVSSSAAFEADGKVVMIHEVGRKFRKGFDGIAARQSIRAEILNQHEILIDDINFVAAGQLPVTSSGKIQRRLVKQLYLNNEFSYLVAKEEISQDLIDQTSSSETQKKIEGIWKQLFDLEQIDIKHNLFDLGGHSLIATRLVGEIERIFAKKVSLIDVLQNPTISSLASLVEKAIQSEDSQLNIISDQDNRFEPFPLTNVQRAYWLGRKSEFELGNVGCHGYYEIPMENFRLECFSDVWNRLIQRHEMLRMVINNSGFQQIIESPPEYQIKQYEMSDASEKDLSNHFKKIGEEMSHQVFTGHTWPLFDIRVSRLSDSQSVVHYSMDALILDASSALILENEMRGLYAKPEALLPDITLSFRDYVLTYQDLKESPRYQRAKQYWSARLDEFPGRPELPLALAPSEIDKPRFERRQLVLDKSSWQNLKHKASTNRATPTVVIIACLSKVIDLWSQNSKFVLNLTLFNRNQSHANINHVVGDFTTTTLLEIDNPARAESFGDGVTRIQHQLWNDLEHKDFDGLEAQHILKQEHGYELGFPIVVTSSLGLETSGRQETSSTQAQRNSIMSGVDARFAITQTPQVWLDIQLYECEHGLCINWDSVEGLFPKGVLDAMCDAMTDLMRGLTNDQQSWSLKAPNFFPRQQSDLIASVNNTDVAVTSDVLHSQIMHSIETYPDNIAIVSKSRTLNYRELGVRSGQLAHQLATTQGVKPPVAVVMQKGWEQIVAVLSVLRVGRAYVPIDAQLPAKRIAVLLDISGAEDVITTANCRDRVPQFYRCHVVQERVQELIGDELSEATIIDVVSAESTAYIIFTSGTTGVPKGVEIKHISALNTVLDINRRFNVSAKDSVLGLSSLSFDLSVYDIFGILGAGGRLVLPSPEETKDPRAWSAYLAEHRVTFWNTAPALISLFASAVEKDEIFLDLRVVMLSGDWIPTDLPMRVSGFSPQANIISLGGATEASIWSIAHEIRHVSHDWVSIPYGRALANQKVVVLRQDFSYCPLWVMGDIYISGVGLAQGYWQDQQKTEASFVFHPETGERLYKTGDKGRLRPCGNIEFLGRVDSQVKIQGHRIELGEVEAAFRSSKLLRDVLVVARDEPKRLVAYAVVDNVSDEASLIDTLRAHLESQLPSFMVPAVIMTLPSIPLTSNGKVDRSKLPETDASQSLQPFVAPTSRIETLLGGIWAELLELEQVGVADNFFALGGNSLLAMQVKSRLLQENLFVSVSDLFGAESLGALASLTSELRSSELDHAISYSIPRECENIILDMLPLLAGLNLTQDALNKIVERVPGGTKNIQDIYPLASNQLGIFLHHTLSEKQDIYVLPNLFSVKSVSHFDSMISNLRLIIERHDVLRTAIIWRDLAVPVQVVCRDVELPIEWLQFADDDDVEAQMIQRCKPAGHWLDLEQPPLMTIDVARDNQSEQHFVLVKIHHSILDHVGLELIFSELAQLQNASEPENSEREHSLCEPPRYRDFVAYSLASAESSQAELFFTQMLSDVVDPSLPFGLQNIRNDGTKVDQFSAPLPSELSAQIRSVTRALHITPAALFHAAWSVVLSACTAQDDVVFGTVLSGRTDGSKSAQNGVGLFLNTLPIRVLIKDQDATALVAELQTALNQLLTVEQASLVLAQRCSGLEAGGPLFSSLLNFRHGTNSKYDAINYIVSHERTNYPLTLSVDDNADGFNLEIQVDASVSAERVVTYVQTVLHELVAELEDELGIRVADGLPHEMSQTALDRNTRVVSQLPFLASSERSYLLQTLNSTESEVCTDQCIHELFESQARLNPDAIALVHDGEQISYFELNAKSNKLAHHLLSLGVKPDMLVALCVERSFEMIIGILAILKSGGAYLPLDPSYPASRLSFMLQDSGASIVLTQEHLARHLPPGDYQSVLFDDQLLLSLYDRQDYDRQNLSKQALGLRSNHLAYVIYTSGSSGQPKGVMIEHKSQINFLSSMASILDLSSRNTGLLLTSISFDIHTLELFLPLTIGAKIVIASRQDAMSGDALKRLIDDLGIDFIQATPSTWQLLLNAGWSPNVDIACLCGGESLPQTIKLGLLANSKVRLLNMYGPTETTVWSSYSKLAIDAKTTLGQPISNTQFYVLSGNNKLLPVGVIGELFIGGAGLARGYLNRPALTQEAFVMNPFSDEKDARLYKTGDLVRWLADGSLEFIGRKDDQVKIRGFRIELGEIEAALTAINGVRQAVVRVQNEPARLVAFLVAESEAIEQSIFLEQSRSRLELSLPQYMIPSIYRVIDELPLTANGKVDRKQLPIVDANQSLQRYIAPKTATEVALCAIWQALLGVERVGLDDNFFRLGGHSLLVMRLLADIRQEIDVELSVRDLFDVSDLGLQARLIDTLGAGTSLSSITAIDRHSNQLPLSFAQQRVWFINQMEGGSSHYNMPLALKVTGGFDVSIAQRAFTQIIQRHETLRTVFNSRNGEAIQLIRAHFKFTLAEQDISGLSIAEQQQSVLVQLKLDADKVFDLEHDLMLRASYIRQSSDEGVLLFNMHHIASDGWSAGVLVNEFTTIYKALHNGLIAVSEALPIQYVDYAHWQREYLQGEMALEQMSYWQAQLADLPPVHSLPLDFSRPQQQRFNGAIYRFDFDLDLLRKLKQTASQHKVTLFMLLHGMFSLMLSRYSNNSDIAIGVPLANRMQKELEGLIGFFVNTIVLRTDVSEEQTLSEYLSHVRTVNVGAQDHQQLPFDYLVEQLNPHRSTAYSPLFQVMFSMDRDQLANLEIASNSFDDIAFEPLLNDDVGSKFDLTLNAIESSDGVLLSFEYNTDLFLAATIERFGDHFLRLLQALASDESLGENDLSEFSMLSDQETDYLLEDLNRTESAYPSELCIHELFEQQVKLNPNAVALVFEAQELTFTELNSRSNRLAHYLVANGVRPDSLVGLCVERSVELVVAILAILKSGGAYMPLEPSYPQARLGYMLDDSKVELLLTMSHIANSLPAGEHRSILLDDEGAFSNCASHNLSPEQLALTPNHLAYVIYTSGSAGQPKGVLQQHKTLNNLVHHQVSDRYLTKPMNSVLLTNMGFDVFMQELATAWYLGSRLYLYRDDLRIDTAKLLNVISEHGIQRLFLVPAVFNALMDSSAQLSTGISGLREVIVAGERLNMTEQVTDYLNCSNTFLINHYGPTETHVVTTFNVVAEDKRHNVLIGNALANHKLYVLGKNLKPIPSGAIGELHVSGVGLARGYLNQAELTQEQFIADPFSGDEGGRLYKTGDLVRRLADGNMEYIGRADDQVKVRGFRIELGEVESALSSIDGVGDAVVVARDEPTRLVAYVTTKAGLQTNDLRATFKAQLQQRLPDYMVPSLFIELDDLPLNANGKLDRQALPEPDASIAQHEYVAPSTDAEKVLCTIWQRLLGVQRIGVTDNFFELGGHSLLAMRLVSEVRSQCNVELVVRDIFNTTQLSDLAALLESAAQNTQLAKIDIVDRSTTSMSLSYSQERLWFIDQMMSGSEHYNLPIALRVSGSFDVTLAEQALQQIIARHEPLRTVYKQTQEGAVQRIATDVDFHLGQQDISQLSVSDQLAVIAERTQSDASLAFNLEQDLMLRAHYLRVSDDSGVLLFNMHHIASDGWSIRILVAEFTTIYQALCSATEPSLLTLTVQYADYAHWQRQQLNSHKLDDQLVYWQTQLAELPTVHELPLDHARPEHQSFNGAVHTIKTDEALFTKLKASAIVNDVTLFMLLQGAFSLLLARHSNTSDIVMGTPMANRLHTDVEGLIGFFVNTLVLRIDVSQETTLSDYLAHVKAVNVDAQMNQQIPFDYLVEQLNPPRSTSYSPLFQVMFSMDINDNQHSPIILEGVEFETLNHDVVAAKFELSLNVTKSDNGLQLSFEYNTDLFNQATIVRLGDHFLRLLDGFANSEDAHAESVKRLPMLSEHETRYLVDDLNNLESDYPAEQCVHELFEAQVALNPEAIALEFEAQELSYGELNKRSNQLAHHLVSHGVKPDTLVGLCVERSLEMVIGILGILKAGGAYVPLDPSYPDARLSYMLSDSGVELLLTQSHLLEKIPTSDQHIIILDDDKNLLLESSENLDKNKLKLTPAHLAYVIYTSGSTGQPKGVMVEHNNVARLFRSSEKHFSFTSNDVWALFHSYAFDFSVWELWGALLYGGKLVVIPHWVVRSFNDFYALLLEQKITVLNQTPSAFQQLIKLDQNSQLGRSLRLIIFGGEKLNPSQLLPWVVRYGCEMPQLINMYGITETTVHVTYKALNQDDVDNSVSVIGNTLDDLESLVLDDHNQLLPLGSIGELHIGGAGLARGYLHREALTAEKFIANPFHQSQAARLYKTGDLVRYLPDGSLEFIGRKDDQIKVRGFRIELGEVESSLLRLTDIRDAVVVARDQPTRLVAYVVAESEQIENESLFIDVCRSGLKATLPDYMLPSLFMLLAEMPLTANGKVDFKSLPSPDASQSLRAFKAPSTKTERVLCGLWQPLLGVERIGVTDNFFELGGHSLLAMQAVSGLQEMGLAVEVRDLFSASNLAELALIIDEKIDVKSFIVPANQIVDQVTDITVEMLPLLGLISDRKLRQSDLDTVISKVPGGRKNIQDIYPLSPTQEGVFYHHVMSQEVDPYLLADLFVADSTQQFEQFMQALRFIFERHDALRTSIFWRALPLPLQVVSLEVEIPVEWIELEPGEDVRAHMQSLSLSGCRSIDLEKGPLFRLEIAKDERSDKHYVLIRHHHILSDNYSIRVMLRDIMAFQKGRANQLPSPRAYRDFVAQSLYQSSHNNASVYFDAMLSSVEQGTLAFGLSDVNGDGTRVDELTESVPDDVSNRIRLHARELKMSPAVLFHAAWSLLLSACSGRDDVVFGTVFSGRLNAAQSMDNTFGMFINTLPMRIRLSDFTAPSLLAQVNTELRGLLLYEQTPLALAQSCSGIPSGSPLFNAVLNYRLSITDDDIGKELIDSGAIMGVRGIDFHERTNYPIGLSIDDLGDRFDLVAQVDRSVGPQRIINYMQVAIEGLLAALESKSNQNASEISVLPAAEVEYLVNTLNDTDSEYPADQCIHQLFEQQVELNPDTVALVFEQQVFEQQVFEQQRFEQQVFEQQVFEQQVFEQQRFEQQVFEQQRFEQQELSYAELNARANQLAHYLRSQGVKPDSLVGLCVERSLEMVIAILAILKAGGAYVPLDPSYPESRLSHMLSDSNVDLLLTQAQWVSVLPEGNHRLLILNDDDEKAIIASKPTSNLVKAEQGLRSDNLAYVIYTSGSTGQPKGVLIEHRSTVALISWSLSVYSKEELTNVAFSTSVCFDLSVYEMFVPLCSGNKVTIIKSLLAASEHKALSQVTLLNTVPSAAGMLIQQEALPTKLKVINLAGEALKQDLVDTLYDCNIDKVYDLYGPSEDTTYSTFIQRSYRGRASIGKPISNTQVYVVGERMQLLPQGVIGELHIGGAGLARGYLNRPELSRDKFIHNPFSAKEGDRLYKTGDLVRWSTEGNLEFIGRKDDQVKLRGFRIELGEVESSLLSLPCVQDAVVVARDEPARLVAYVAANPQAYTDESLLIEACRSALRSALPDYMVPSLFMLLDEIPLTPNGKVDRKGLPAPDATQSLQKYVAPSTETEQILCELWQTLLEVERVGITDNFFELGGHSLLAMQVISGLQQAGLEIEIRDLLTAPNLGELARVADQKAGFSRYIVPANIIVNGCTQLTLEMLPLLSMVAERTISQSGLDSLVLKVPGGVSNIQDIYPLSPTQEGIFYHHVVPEGADPYVLSALFELANIEQLESFLATLQFVFDRHDTLRTSVYWQGLEFPVQVVVRNAEVPIEWLSLDSDRPVRAQMESLCEPGNHQLDIEQGPLLRVEVAKDHQSDKVYMIVVLHHIISDHVGFEIIQREAWAHQNGFADTLSKPRAYREFVGQSLQQTKHRDAAAYFSEMLSDVDDATLPFGLSDVQGDGSRIVEMVTSLPNQVSKRIRLASKALKISPAVLFHAAWSLVVSACSGRSDIVFGTVLSGRLQGTQGAQDTLGMFINTLPLRVKLVDTDVVTLLSQIHINLTELLSFEQTSLALAQSCSSVSAGAPLFSSILNYRHSALAVDAVVEGDHNSSTIQLLNAYERTNYPMAMSVDDFGDGFNLVAQLDRSVNPQRLFDYMYQAIESILLELEQGANRNVTELSVLPAAEVDRLLNQLNDTASVPLTAKCIHELFEQQVRLNPNSVALVFEEQQLTYANLNQRSNRLAHYLLSQGVKPDSLVGLCVERSLDMVIAILGILKAGGSYVPLDPSHPTARLSYMLSDSGVSLLLTQQRFVSVLPKGDHQLVLLDHNDQPKLFAEHSNANPDKVRQGLRTDNLAYVIYTSGSTGQPKGVLCTHEALINRIDWMAREYAVGPEDKVLQKTPYTFDVSVWEFVLPLTQGSCLVMAKPEGHKDPVYLKQVIQEHGITILHFVPSMLSAMLSAVDLSACNSLSRVFCSGEALPKPLEEQFFANMASATQLHNLYGPTEAAIDVSYWACEQGSSYSQVPIGRPISNTQLLVLDQHKQLLPQGVVGELHIGGLGLARGYLNRPELTQERFIANRFSSQPGARLYKTGDLVHWLADGNLAFIGRIDDQVKIRGFRIELGEIESTLLRLDNVREAAVIAYDEPTSLVAFVVPTFQDGREQADFIEQCRSSLKLSLPDYMLPSLFVVLDEIPLTPNGKVDRNSLNTSQLSIGQHEFVAPTSKTEQMLCEIWQDLLGIEQVGITDNFFELGGHSLLAIRMVTHVNTSLSINLNLREIFTRNTIRSIAALIELEIKLSTVDIDMESDDQSIEELDW